MGKHWEHGSALVRIGGVEFFADSASLHEDDEAVGQMLCNIAFWFGYACGFAHDCGSAQITNCSCCDRPSGECLYRRDDYELSGWNNKGAGI